MKSGYSILAVLVLSASLGGCAVPNLLGGGSDSSSAPAAPRTVATGNPLALPPDLRLNAPPSTVSDAYQPNTIGAPPGSATSVASAPSTATVAGTTPTAAAAQPEDNYAKYGISKVNADGSPKSKADLQAELKAAMIKQKRQSNPNYGTVFNIGNIFGDG